MSQSTDTSKSADPAAVPSVAMIINGQEVACHNLNKVRGTTLAIETIELYHFDAGRLLVRYFIRQP